MISDVLRDYRDQQKACADERVSKTFLRSLLFFLRQSSSDDLREKTYIRATRAAELRVIGVLGCTSGTVHGQYMEDIALISTNPAAVIGAKG